MSSRSYAEINLHLTWHTKDNYPFVTNRLKPDLYAFIKNRVVEDRQAYFHAVGGIADHVHLAASFFPPLEIDNWIGQIKGASSHEFGKALQWQSGYGVVSFGTRDLIWVFPTFTIKKNATAQAGSRIGSSVIAGTGKGVENALVAYCAAAPRRKRRGYAKTAE